MSLLGQIHKFFGLGRNLVTLAIVTILVGFWSTPSMSEAFKLGPKKCQGCHKAEYTVWEKSPHAKSFKKIHKSKKAKKIVKAVGGKRMKKEALCANCHYTSVKKGKKLKIVAGPSCESCHGAASDWINIHNAKKPKAEKIAAASAKGMIWPSQLFDVATNCNSCHGLANPKLKGEKIKAMLDAGHPINPDFELVKYSQGVVRHRFYPPKVTENQVMSPAGMSRMYVIGQAANLVAATGSLSKSSHPAYQAAQKKRIATAKAILTKIPEAAKLVSAPTKENGRALWEAIKAKDLTSVVGSKLPKDFK
ncbi:MAG: hypothetical protein CMM51_06180 [Rhodospirillaceae bacterium]|nr:hypothetical protein [Rhodospirillaceae bacterium]